jgi:hypothetical protein
MALNVLALRDFGPWSRNAHRRQPEIPGRPKMLGRLFGHDQAAAAAAWIKPGGADRMGSVKPLATMAASRGTGRGLVALAGAWMITFCHKFPYTVR